MAISIPIISEFNGKGIQQALQEFKQLEGGADKAKYAIKKAFLPATAVVAGLAYAAKDVVQQASDLAEAQSKIGVVFGDGADEVDAFAKTASSRIGQSRRQVLNAAGTFGVFGKAAGLSGEELADFSNEFVTLAADIASFSNTSPEEAIQAIGAALRGESEPIRKYGVLLDDATLKQAAMELGIYDGSGALTAQQRVLAAQKTIFEQTGDAQGDFTRTSDGLANSQKTLAAQIDDIKTSIGVGLLPVVEQVIPFVKAFATWASDNPGAFAFIAGTIGLVAAAIIAVNVAMALNPFALIAGGIVIVGAAIFAAYQKFEGFRNIMDAIFDALKWYVRMAKEQFLSLVGVFKTVFNTLADLWNNSFGKISFNIPSWVPGVGGKSFDVPNIPKLADGGIVTGPTLALIGEAGPEAVVPLSKLSNMGGNTNVTINVQGADPQAVVDALRTYMFRNGSVPIRVA